MQHHPTIFKESCFLSSTRLIPPKAYIYQINISEREHVLSVKIYLTKKPSRNEIESCLAAQTGLIVFQLGKPNSKCTGWSRDMDLNSKNKSHLFKALISHFESL